MKMILVKFTTQRITARCRPCCRYRSNSEADAVQTAIYIEFKIGAVSTEIVQVTFDHSA